MSHAHAILGVSLALAACAKPASLEWKAALKASSVSTPLVTDNFIAVGHEQGVSIIEMDGSLRCSYETWSDVISAPKTNGELIYFGSTNYIFYAIDSTCRLKWKYTTGDRIKSDPLVLADRVITTSYDRHVYALKAQTGELLWMFPAKVAPPSSTDANAALQTTEAPGDFSYSSPVEAKGVIYIGNYDGNLYAIASDTGALLWRFETEAPITSTPLIYDETVFFGSNDRHVYAVNARTHRLKWKFPVRDWVNSSARIDDNVLYIGSNDRSLYALDAETGATLWKYEASGPIVAVPAVYKNSIVVAGGRGDGTLSIISKTTHEPVWYFTTGGKIESDPQVVGDKLYVSSTDQNLYAFRLNRKRLSKTE